MIYFTLFCIWYTICAIGVGKAITNAYDKDMDDAVIGSVLWPFVILAWAFWG